MEKLVRQILSLAFLLLASCDSANADVLKAEAELQPFTEEVMASVATGDFDAAFTTMKPFFVIPAAEIEALAMNTKAQRGNVGGRFGKSIGYECVGMKKVGQSLVKITCIEKTEMHALPWVFYFYKTPAGWVLNSFNWNSDLTSLFE